MDTKEGKVIKNYVDGYNEFDVEKMTAGFSRNIVFRHIQNGEVTMTLNGIEAFKKQAEQAKAYFRSRKQKITAIRHDEEDKLEIDVNYSAVLATDFPNGLKKGDRLELKGKSVFKFLDDKIVALTDIS